MSDEDVYDCCDCGQEFPLDEMACLGEGVYYCDACAEAMLAEEDDGDEE